ncbi:MAG: CpaD family pilus assembly lipoprotein [Polymorphobacter sp.]
MKIALVALALATPLLAQPAPQPATEHVPAACRARPLVMGCANAANLAAMLADPADLERPRAAAPAIGTAAVLPIERYRTGKPLALPMADAQSGGGATPQ